MANEVRVLIPLDGSKLAEHALAYVAALKSLGEEVVELVMVMEGTGEQGERERNMASSYLSEVASEVRQHVGVRVDAKLLLGPPVPTLLAEAEAFNSDLVVISTHGATGISRWRLGSVADKIVRGASRNVLLIGPKAAEREQWLLGELTPAFKSVLLPLDGSELAEQALPVAQRIAEAFDSQLHLVRVQSLTAMGGDAAWAGAYSSEAMDDLTREASEYLESKANQLPMSINARLNIQIGTPADSLSQYVAEQNIDLVVMTSHGRGGMVRAALGSVTDRLLGGPAPVLVVRANEETV